MISTVTPARAVVADKPRAGVEPPSRRRRPARLRAAELLFVLPALALVLGVIVVPGAIGVAHSLTDWQPGYTSPFVGLDNYTSLFTSPTFRQVLFNQAVFLLVVPISTMLALGLAYLLQERIPAPGIFRTVLFFPSVLPAAVAGIAFVFVLSPSGPLNAALGGTGLGGLRRNWLADSFWVKPVLIGVLVWSTVGIGVMIFSAALGTIPRDLLEAIRLDGAGAWGEFRYIVVPALRPTIGLYAIVLVIQVFLWSFPWVYVMTSGGPGYASTTIDWDVYQNTIRFGKFGVGAAESVVILMLVGAVLGLAAFASRRARAAQ